MIIVITCLFKIKYPFNCIKYNLTSFQLFLLKAPNEEQLVASGLVINATLKFDCKEEGHYEDKIIAFVDNEPVVVPIKVLVSFLFYSLTCDR